ncbi:SPOSA6832_02842 [Sporobolomyces salmonicolor]|uniref:SPOSA6832_02842-mRNA-1:cds n=1 Tax=Sporidiobolus salmonicolor TaxID=5005 RepID=A0A0D6EMQ6_SPOSA|nr:SPOSA6832_02842 [Sporobolomyces salmonicolor]
MSAHLPPLLVLPSELLIHILDLTLPAVHTCRTSPERSATLRALALVHPVLRGFAQGRLFRDCILYSDQAVEKLARLTCAPKGRGHELGNTIVSLRVFGSLRTGDGGKALARLVKQLAKLEVLHLEDLDGLELRAFVLHPPHDDAFSGFSLPSLRNLTLRDISLPPPSALATLEPSDAFKIHAVDAVRGVGSLSADETHLAFFVDAAQRRFSPDRPVLARLEHLQIVKFSSLSYLLGLLPTGSSALPLRTLHLIPPSSFLPVSTSRDKADAHFESLVAPFRSFPHGRIHPVLKWLDELVLDEKYLVWLEHGEERVEEVMYLCEKNEIEVRFEQTPVGMEIGRRRRANTGETRSSMSNVLTGGSRVRRYTSADV